MHFQIYTMYVNRKDLLADALTSLGPYGDLAVIIDNSKDKGLCIPGFRGEIITPPVPLFCSQSYNLILQTAVRRHQDVFFIMHSDARFESRVVDRLLTRAGDLDRAGRRWGVLFTNYDVLCLCNTRTLRGYEWDQNLPLYYTDADFYRRLALDGIELVETDLPVEHQEEGSTVRKSDPALGAFVETNYAAWRQYYMRKWGGERGEETFTRPFGPAE